jgi:hypothetical protein
MAWPLKRGVKAERLREILNYEPMTGEFRWRQYRSGRARAGAVAGTVSPLGYRVIHIEDRAYLAHRLAWVFVYGEWPAGMLDHANHDPLDNRISNLRLATVPQNRANSKVRSDNIVGLKGVRRQPRSATRWAARITRQGKTIFLGSFPSPEEAHAAYCSAAKEIFGDFARTA